MLRARDVTNSYSLPALPPFTQASSEVNYRKQAFCLRPCLRPQGLGIRSWTQRRFGIATPRVCPVIGSGDAGFIITGSGRWESAFPVLSLLADFPVKSVCQTVESMAPHSIEAITSPSSWAMVSGFRSERCQRLATTLEGDGH